MAAVDTASTEDISKETPEIPDNCSPDQTQTHETSVNEDANGVANGRQVQDSTFSVTVRLPHAPYKTETIVSTQDQAQDVRQSIVDIPHTFQYSCFHLEQNGQRLPDFIELGDIPGFQPDVELNLIEDPYTEKDARMHFLRIRELIGAAGDRTDLVHGIQAGLSLHDSVVASCVEPGHVDNNDAGKPSSIHPLVGYNMEAPGSMSTLVPPAPRPRPKTVKSIGLSPWNPPPYHLRSKGHLLYLQVTAMEGENYQITSHVTGFYVNRSSNSKFDPFPRTVPKNTSAHSLLTLLSRLSPLFDQNFKALQDFKSQRDPLSAFQLSNAIPASPWAVASHSNPLLEHHSDSSRSQEPYLESGAGNAETLRDWNEEFQTTRELPRDSVQDRVFRERVTSKLFADYNEAATQGAVLIARGEVAPLNPTENKDAQIFVYNNIFYSFGADGVGTFANEGGDEAARVATGKDVVGVRNVNQLDIPGLSTPGTVLVDYLGKRLVGQSIVPGIFKQREPGENQIDYGGVEGKDIVADNKVFVPAFEKLSMAMHVKKHPVWDAKGDVHELEASIETKGLLGTDGRKYVLDLYRITPLDVSWIEKYWIESSPENGKQDGKIGYPHRMAVLRPELVDSYWRLKLREYVNAEAVKREQMEGQVVNALTTNGDDSMLENQVIANGSEKTPHVNGDTTKNAQQTDEAPQDAGQKEPEQDRVDVSGFEFALNPDVYSGQKPKTENETEAAGQDEAEVRAACDYLLKEVLPRFVRDLQEGDVGFPMDGQSLCSILHKSGINIRYLGQIAELADGPNPRLQALRQLAVQEMIVRAFKHVCNTYLCHLPAPITPACISHLLNCFLGSEANSKPTASIDDDLRHFYREENFEFEKAQPERIVNEIAAQVSLRYRFTLDSKWRESLKHLQILREICLKLGLQLSAKEYHFAKLPSPANRTNVHFEDSPSPVENGNGSAGGKKKKKGASPSCNGISPTMAPQTFQPDDIQNIVPVIKEASPRSVLADEALEAGRISIAQNQREIGQELLLESLSLHEQIYGIIHPEVARVYYQLSTVYYGLDDKNIAVELARKAVIVSERTLGVDASETLLAYLNLGLFEHANGNTRTALTCVRHALNLWKLVYGPQHPDSITTMNNIAVMLQHLKLYHDSRIWFETSFALCQSLAGPNSINAATLLFQLAQALALDGDSKAAVHRMRQAYNIFNAELGSKDRNTREAESWLEQLTQNAVSIAKHAKDVQARRLRRIPVPPRVTLGTRAQPQAGRTTAADASDVNTAVAAAATQTLGARLDERSVDELLRYIEGGDTSKQTKKPKETANPKRRQQRAR